jgi:hypothetical protein
MWKKEWVKVQEGCYVVDGKEIPAYSRKLYHNLYINNKKVAGITSNCGMVCGYLSSDISFDNGIIGKTIDEVKNKIEIILDKQ